MSNVGYATLSIIPSAKGFLRALRQETKGPLADFAKEIGEAISSQAAEALGDGLGDVDSRVLGQAIRATTSASTERGLREGVDKGAGDVEERLRAGVGSAFRDGFRRGFRGLLSVAREQDGSLRRALSFGVAGGILQGSRQGFSAAREAVSSFADGVKEALNAAGKTALSAITGAITATAGTAATGGLNLLVGALLAIVAAVPAVIAGFLALAPVLSLVGGLAGSVFTVAFGGAATLGVLALATQGLGDAFKELAADGAVSRETLRKLAPSAAKFVQAIAKLRKPFADLSRFVQGKVFQRITGPFERLTRQWLPALKPMLGGLASQLSTFAATALKSLGDTTFIRNIRAAVEGFGGFIARIGRSIGPLIGAFGRLAASSVPFLAELGDRLGGVIDRFSAWIAQASKSGELDAFMKSAANSLRQIWAIGGEVIGILGEVVEILFPQSKKEGGTFLEGVRSSLEKVRTWLADPKNQQAIRDWIAKIQEFIDKAANEWIPAIGEFISKVGGWVGKIQSWADRFESFRNRVAGAVAFVAAIVTSTASAISGALLLVIAPLIIAGNGFGAFAAKVREHINRAGEIVRGLPGRLISSLSGLGGAMAAAGGNAIAGFVSGLRGGIGTVRAVGASIGAAALAAAKAALEVRSPSRKMRELGMWTVKGFVAGMVGGTAEVKATAAKLANLAYKALRDRGLTSKAAHARVEALTRALAPKQAQITALAKRWDALADKLKDARDKLADAVKARNDFAKAVRDSIIGTASIADIRTDNAASIVEVMKARLAEAQTFGAVLEKLRKAGLNATTYRQLVEAGPESLVTAEALLNGGKAAISEVNAIQAALAKTAGAIGSKSSGALYQSGVDAAKGLVRGLQSQMGAIEKQMTAIAKAMVKAIKKQLKIKSPSRVFATLGRFVGQGFALGVTRSSSTVTKAVNALTAIPPARAVSVAEALAAKMPPAAPGETHYHLHDSKATLGQLRALQERQAITARAGRAR